jgi:hypothetical protein
LKYFSNCPNAQEIGILYAKDGILRISGLIPKDQMRPVPKIVHAATDKDTSIIFSEKLETFYNKEIEDYDKLDFLEQFVTAVQGNCPMSVAEPVHNTLSFAGTSLKDILVSI